MKKLLAIIAMSCIAAAPMSNGIVTWANVATESQLCEVSGIGPVLAGRIIAGRPYKSVAGVNSVKGIGPVLMDRINYHVEHVAD